MICRLCLKEVNEFKSVFDVAECKLDMASIIAKHFWFELQQNDQISTVICNNCWLKVSDFHEFYKSVEKAQSNLGENVVVKIENNNVEHSIENVMIQSIPFSNKLEPNDDLNESNDEDPFEMPIDEADNNPSLLLKEKDLNDKRFSTNATEGVANVINYKNEKFDSDDGDPFSSGETKIGKKRESTKLSKKEKSIKCARTTRMKNPSPKLPRNATEKGTRKLSKSENNDSKKTKVKKPLEDPKSVAIDEEIAKFMKLHCERCKLEVTNFSALQSHMLAEHNIKGYARCCHRRFSSRFLLIDHIRQHSNPDSLKCEPCNRVFADRNSMRNHLLIKHQKDEDKMFSCSRCPKKFVKMYLLRQHELVGHSDHKNACLAVDEEIAKFMPLHCELCNVEVENFTALKGHMRVEHNMKGYMRCCNRKFFERGLLAEHIRTHLNPACYKCEKCSLVFPDRKSMRNHFLMIHQKKEDKPFACSQCSNKFVTVYLLQLHKVVAHGDPTNTCKSCSRKFNTAGELTAHIKEQCLCDTCAEVICGVAAFQHHILGHEKSLAGSKDSNVCDICRQDKHCVHNSARTYECKVSSLHENFPFPYQYASTSQENASTTMLTHTNYTHSSNDH
uniref:Transcription factor grauzone n=1 Tax=Glossina austeni TaxID=7395 RepID=A0A1A9UY42_GLOAU